MGDVQTLEEILAEWDAASAKWEASSPYPSRPGTGRLAFSAPLPEAPPPIFEQMERGLAPLRDKLNEIEFTYAERDLRREEEHRQRLQAMQDELNARPHIRVFDDRERAAAAIHNVSTNPAPEFKMPSNEVIERMNEQQYQDFLADYRNRR